MTGPQGERPRRAVPAKALGQDADQCRGSLPLRGQFQDVFTPHVGGAGTHDVVPRKPMCAAQLRAVHHPETCRARGRWPGRTPGDARGQWRWHPGGPCRVRDGRSSCPSTPLVNAGIGSPHSHAPCPGEAALSARVMSCFSTRRSARPSPNRQPLLVPFDGPQEIHRQHSAGLGDGVRNSRRPGRAHDHPCTNVSDRREACE